MHFVARCFEAACERLEVDGSMPGAWDDYDCGFVSGSHIWWIRLDVLIEFLYLKLVQITDQITLYD